jgi:hypothetical protein
MPAIKLMIKLWIPTGAGDALWSDFLFAYIKKKAAKNTWISL